MLTSELLEHALLDAVGLLEDDERLAFDQAFAAASPAIQAHVRAEQTRFVRSEIALLPQTEPPAALRAAVIEAVRNARLSETAASPAATSGRATTARTLQNTAGQGNFGQGNPGQPIRHRRLRAVSVWRASALAFAAAAVVFGWSTFQMRTEYSRLAEAQRTDADFEAMAAEFGRQFVVDALVDSDTQRYTFRNASTSGKAGEARAAVWNNPDWKTARFFAVSLPPSAPGSTYRLAVLDENGTPIQDVLRFEFAGQLVNRTLHLDVALQNPVLGIISTDDQGQDEILLITSNSDDL
jgi:hypothetical protein